MSDRPNSKKTRSYEQKVYYAIRQKSKTQNMPFFSFEQIHLTFCNTFYYLTFDMRCIFNYTEFPSEPPHDPEKVV